MTALKAYLTRSLARQITVLFAVLLLIVGLAVSLVSYVQVLRLTRQAASDRLKVLAAQLAPLLGRSHGETLIRFRKAAADPAIIRFVTSHGADGREGATAVLGSTLQTTLNSAAVVTDQGGSVLLEVGPPRRGPWFGPPPRPPGALPADSAPMNGPFYRLNDTTLFTDLSVPIREGGRSIGL